MISGTWVWAALALARPECGSDGGSGCLELATRAEGRGRVARAERLRERACTPVHPGACEPWWSTDREAAQPILDEAADACANGADATCRELADWHLDGPLRARDHRTGHRLLRLACDRNDAASCVYLGYALEASTELRDHPGARARLERACELQSAEGCHESAWRAIQGSGGPVDIDQAYAAMDTACRAGRVAACEDLAAWHTEGRGRDPDPERAGVAWGRACDLEPSGCAEIVRTVLDARRTVQTRALAEVMKPHCGAGSPSACAGLVMLGLDAEGDGRRLACLHEHAPACEALAADQPAPIRAQIGIHVADREALTDAFDPWDLPEGPRPWLPDVAELEACVNRIVEAFAEPEWAGRGTPSPGYDAAATVVEKAFTDAGLQVSRSEVLVPRIASREGSWVRVGAQSHEAFAVDGSAPGAFRGRVRVLSRPPAREDLTDLDDIAAVLFEAPRFEDQAAQHFVRAPVPVLAVPIGVARAAHDHVVAGVARPARPGERVENVYGALKGSGELADEVVLLGAHLDGQGFDPDGAVRPSADDNASGVAGMVCAAEALARHPTPLHRTLVFAAFGAEELGLFGSRNHLWTQRPDPVAMINLDMIGRLGERPVEVRAYGTDWPARLGPVARALDLELVDGRRDGLSDHVPFALAGVPSVMLHSGLHGDYHRETDTFDRLDRPGVVRIAALAAATMASLAHGPRLAEASDPCTELTDEPLGVGWVLDAMNSDRRRVRCVRERSLGEALGVMPGDQVLDWDGLEGWPLEPASVVVERRGGCFVLGMGDESSPVPCESAP